MTPATTWRRCVLVRVPACMRAPPRAPPSVLPACPCLHPRKHAPARLQEAVAAYEAKYNRLKGRYRQLSEAHRQEVDGLHEEIAGLQARAAELQATTAQLEATQ